MPSSRYAAWSPRKKRWFKLHMKKWGLFGTLVDVEKIKARKLHLVKFGCFGTEVDADVIEARKQALRDWWTPARRQAASERWTPKMREEMSDAMKARWTPEMRQAASDAKKGWWTDSRRDDHGDFMANWWSDEEEGAARREANGLSSYLRRAAQRGDPNPPEPICLPAGTHCPACGDALGNRVIMYIEVKKAQGSVRPIIRFICPHKTCGSQPYITDATKRAAVLATVPGGEGGDELEKAIVERMVLAVDRFNCALAKQKGKKKGAASKPFVLPAFVTVPQKPRYRTLPKGP